MLPRPRLFERLDSWDDVTVVTGPLGAGKTTLLAAWAATLSSPVFWCEPSDGLLPMEELEAFAARGAGVLIVDDGEQIEARQFEHLGALVDRYSGLRVVMSSQSARAARELAASCDAALNFITASELLITLDELRDAGVLADDEARLELLRRSEGFAVAVREKMDDALHGSSGARERLRRVLGSELREHQGRYEAALRISLLQRVDGRIIAAWGLPESALEDLNDAGVVSREGEWLSMHPFIRGVLLEEAQQHLSPSERQRLIADAVRASFIGRDPLQALSLALAIDDLELATEVALANIVDLLEIRDATYGVVTRLPASKLRGYPVLTLMLVLLSNMDPDTRPRAVQLLATESLFQRLHPNRSSYRERVLYRAFEAAALRLTPFSGRALPLIRRAVDDFSMLSEEDFEAFGRMGPMMQVHLGIGAYYLNDIELARKCFEIADAKHAEAGRADRVDPLSLRAGLAALNGELPLARRLIEEADAAEWPEGWRGSSPADFFHLCRAVLALEDGDPDAAAEHLAAAGPIVELVEHWRLYALIRAHRDRAAGEIDLGLMRLRSLREQRGSAPGTAWSRSLLDAAEAELLLAAGQPAAARRFAARAAKHGAAARLALARVELALDRFSAAAVQARRVLGSPTTPRHQLEAELVLICAALRAGQRDDAEGVARRIAELIRLTGLRAPLRVVPLQVRDALRQMLGAEGIEPSILDFVGADADPALDAAAAMPTLTTRERAVLGALAHTGSLDEIAAQLFISRNTVKTQLRTVYRKLGVSSRDAALTRAALLGLLEHSED